MAAPRAYSSYFRTASIDTERTEIDPPVYQSTQEPNDDAYTSIGINIILMVREHGTHQIAETNEEIAILESKLFQLQKKRETLQRLVDIANEYDGK